MIVSGWRWPMQRSATEPDGEWELAAAIGAKAGGLDKAKLLERARSPEVEARARATTAEFHAFHVTQRPTFLIDSEIGDRAIFSGIAALPPIIATIDAMLEDLAAYESHAAHFGAPPAVILPRWRCFCSNPIFRFEHDRRAQERRMRDKPCPDENVAYIFQSAGEKRRLVTACPQPR